MERQLLPEAMEGFTMEGQTKSQHQSQPADFPTDSICFQYLHNLGQAVDTYAFTQQTERPIPYADSPNHLYGQFCWIYDDVSLAQAFRLISSTIDAFIHIFSC